MVSTVIGIIDKEDSNGFTGIFTHTLPRRSFLDNTHILFSSAQRCPMVSTMNSLILCVLSSRITVHLHLYRYLSLLT